MAEINVERKGASIWPWILGLLLLGLLIWGVAELLDDDVPEVATTGEIVDAPVAPAAPIVDPAATALPATPDVDVGPVIPVAAIVTTPANYGNQTVSGTARVAEVISDRGFWIEDGGQRIFAVIDEPKPEIKNVQAGQMVRLDGAQVMTNASQVPGQLESQTQQVIQGQPAFLYVRAPSIFITQTAG